MTLTLNLISFSPILSLLFSIIFISEFFFAIVNNTASIFSTSKLTALRIFHLITTSLTSYRIVTMSSILLSMMNPRSSIKNRLMIWGIFSFTSSNIPLIYIRKSIGDTGEPCGMPVLTGTSGLIYPSIISSTLLSASESYNHPPNIYYYSLKRKTIFYDHISIIETQTLLSLKLTTRCY